MGVRVLVLLRSELTEMSVEYLAEGYRTGRPVWWDGAWWVVRTNDAALGVGRQHAFHLVELPADERV